MGWITDSQENDERYNLNEQKKNMMVDEMKEGSIKKRL